MQQTLGRVTKETTVALLVAGFVLIGAGLGGLRGGAPLVGGLVAATVVAYLLRTEVPDLGVHAGHDLGLYVRDAWIAFGVATVVVLFLFGATPGELQTAGGLLGLGGMLNYFLRPLYFGVYGFAASRVGGSRPENG